VQLQRRADLIPNLVETVKLRPPRGEHFHRGRERAGAARRCGAGRQPARDGGCEHRPDRPARPAAPRSPESYPQLKANENFRALQDQLEGTENRIAVARQDYNEAVNRYNAYIRRFPQVLTAKIIGKKSGSTSS